MRLTAAVKRRPPAVVAQGVPIPAPVGGWDAISPLANMPVDRAVVLDNWIPRPGWIEPRPGYTPQATGLGAAVQTVMAYNGFGGTFKLFGVAGSNIYDVTNSGPAVATTVNTLSSPRLQYLQFSNPSYMQYLIACNGVDTPVQFDGTSWTAMSGITGTGVVPSSFINVAAHQGRLWFVQANSTNAVYMTTVGGITGTAAIFPLGQFFTKGGYLVAIGTWTVDTRQNVDEYIAFISSRGQVIVYAGTDPSTANTFQEVGIYNIGRPIGSRCFSRIAGDLLIITIDGVVGMSEMLSTDRAAANRVSLTSIIMNAINQSAQAYSTNFGWQIIEHPLETLSIVNIPVKENTTQIQYTMNTITGAWCSMSGINANCWEVTANDAIFFGGNDGTVYRWNSGSLDNGKPITCLVRTAYNSFGNAPQRKRYTAIQPLLTTTGNPIPAVGIDVDFSGKYTLSTPQPYNAPGSVPLWGQVNWNQFNWPIRASTSTVWQSVAGAGHYVSIVTQVLTTGIPGNLINQTDLQLQGWNITAESGAFV
jgi:hypothetical protein